MNTLCNEPTTITCANAAQQTCQLALEQSQRKTARISHWISRAIGVLRKRINQRLERQAFNTLLRLDDQMLKDIGVTRMDVKWASNLPLSQDAALRLEAIARRR